MASEMSPSTSNMTLASNFSETGMQADHTIRHGHHQPVQGGDNALLMFYLILVAPYLIQHIRFSLRLLSSTAVNWQGGSEHIHRLAYTIFEWPTAKYSRSSECTCVLEATLSAILRVGELHCTAWPGLLAISSPVIFCKAQPTRAETLQCTGDAAGAVAGPCNNICQIPFLAFSAGEYTGITTISRRR